MADTPDGPSPHDAFEAATTRGLAFERDHPKETAARYDASSGRLVIDFANGSTLLVPARSLQDLTEASDADLAEVTLHHDYYFRWEALDVDFTVPGLAAGLFGTAAFMRTRIEPTQPSPVSYPAAPRVPSQRSRRTR